MGFHNLLAGQDLHEPSRVRVANNTTLPLGIGQLVKIGGPVAAVTNNTTCSTDVYCVYRYFYGELVFLVLTNLICYSSNPNLLNSESVYLSTHSRV